MHNHLINLELFLWSRLRKRQHELPKKGQKKQRRHLSKQKVKRVQQDLVESCKFGYSSLYYSLQLIARILFLNYYLS
jgi:hypothetical protein